MAMKELYWSMHTHPIFPKKRKGPNVCVVSIEHMQPIKKHGKSLSCQREVLIVFSHPKQFQDLLKKVGIIQG